MAVVTSSREKSIFGASRYRNGSAYGEAQKPTSWRKALEHSQTAQLFLSQTSSGWRLIENQAILLWDEGYLWTYWLDDRSTLGAGHITSRHTYSGS